MTQPQIIESNGEPAFVVLPYAEYEALRARLEDLEDVQAFDEAMADAGEAFPHAIARRLLDDESPLRVFRQHRGLTQAALAREAGVSKSYVAKIEAGRGGSVAAYKALADVLGLSVDDLID